MNISSVAPSAPIAAPQASAPKTPDRTVDATTLDAAPADNKEKQDAAMAEFRKQVQGTYDTAADKSMWRETAKEVRQVLEQRLGLAAKK